MLSKIKGALQVNDSISELTQLVKEQVKTVKELSEQVIELRNETKLQSKELSKLTDGNRKSLEEFQGIIKELNVNNSELKKEIDTFKLSKANLHNFAIKELKDSLRDVMEFLRSDKIEYEKIQKVITGLTDKVSNDYKLFEGEIEKLIKISKTVKEMDFNLLNYTHKLDKFENEKMKLIREVDKLETMIARMKRN